MTFVLLTRRDPRTDFRVFLAEALHEAGHACYIIRPFRKSTISFPFSAENQTTVGLLGLLKTLRRISRESQPITVIDSLNLGLPMLCLVLRFLSLRAIWAYDLHDHLLYDLHGLARLIGAFKLRTHHALASFTFHAAPTLAEIFPRSHRLGNASHLRRRRVPRAGADHILILASIDERFSFDLVQEVTTNPALSFHIYGSLAEGSTLRTRKTIHDDMNALIAKPNVYYHGSYVNADLEGILSQYSVMLAPYKLSDPSTRYIEPLRYYHALNNGVAVLTTGIPAAETFGTKVHVVSDRASFERALKVVTRDPKATFDAQPEITWRQRADELSKIISSYRLSLCR